ncbi:MAG: HAD-IIIA family hydrolase [Bacteroidales bacterium]|nr:HAD-IIIA family hydrolase [Bacteroidales bacterium]
MYNQAELKNEWSLFLDRDGVINKRIIGGYVQKPEELEFLPGSLKALQLLSNIFKYVFIVTNQQGIGKGLMNLEDLRVVHRQMLGKIKANGGRIDSIFFCPDLATKSPNCRKPGLAMAQMAKKEFPTIDFKKSYMVGDSKSDIEFGQNAEMQCAFIIAETTEKSAIPFAVPVYPSLLDFVNHLKSN